MKAVRSVWVFVVALALAGCVGSQSGQVYSRGNAQQAQRVELGTVQLVKSVKVEGTKSGLGAVGGAVVGGVAGNQIGGGSGRNWATLGGALAGAAGGAVAEEKVSSYDGLEITIALDSGSTVVVVQAADVMFSVGERVRVITAPDGTTRVTR